MNVDMDFGIVPGDPVRYVPGDSVCYVLFLFFNVSYTFFLVSMSDLRNRKQNIAIGKVKIF